MSQILVLSIEKKQNMIKMKLQKVEIVEIVEIVKIVEVVKIWIII